MAAEYGEVVAAHYRAYRPALHHTILTRVLHGSDRFSDALDVGCGTGRSSVALAEFSQRVYAIDPGQSMLDAAAPHAGISYIQGSGENIPLTERSVDLVTFAGSLFYADTKATARELQRVCRHNALIVVYDFDVRIADTLERLGVAAHVAESSYDYSANFHGVRGFRELLRKRDRIEFDILPTDLAHVLLSNAARHDVFVTRYKTTTPHTDLAADLARSDNTPVVAADIYYSSYRLDGHR